MKITDVKLSVFEAPVPTGLFNIREQIYGASQRWVIEKYQETSGYLHVLHVRTDEGVEGMCTVGDARYTTMRQEDLDQLRFLVVGDNPLDRERLDSKLRIATRHMFTLPGWYGSFDNCLWDIAGKVADLPVCELIGRVRDWAPSYFNIKSSTQKEALEDCELAISDGFVAIKDHFQDVAIKNEDSFRVVRNAVGPDIDVMHDAASCRYDFEEALRIGNVLKEMEFRWFEEPLSDRDHIGLKRLCVSLEIPVLAAETLMNDRDLSAFWLISGATDLLRVNARHGVTSLLKLANLAEMHGTNVEMNGPGGLFGLVHAQLMCSISNTSYYEYFPGGSRDEVGKEIGLMNPPMPEGGKIKPPETPGFGAEWDKDYFHKMRVAEL